MKTNHPVLHKLARLIERFKLISCLRMQRKAIADRRYALDQLNALRSTLAQREKRIKELEKLLLDSRESEESRALSEFIKSQKPMDADMARAARKVCDELIRNAHPTPITKATGEP